MSDQLKKLHIDLAQGYSANDLPKADLYIIGNALSRGNESVEHILENNLPFKSGPDNFGEMLQKNVISISGTHGKTTILICCAIFF